MRNAILLAVALLTSTGLSDGAAPAAKPAEDPAAAAVRAQRANDARAKRMIQQAKSLLEEGDEARALGLFAAVEKMFPESEMRFVAMLELGRAHLAKGRTDEALAVLRKTATAKNPDVRAESYFLQARAQLAAGKDGEASMLLRRITVDFPDSPFANDAWYEIGQVHFKAKRWTRAQEAFRRVGTAVPKSVEAGTNATPVVKAVFAEAGQRLYACVEDRDIAVATDLGKKLSVTFAAANGDRETVEIVPFGTEGVAALASVPTAPVASKPEDGLLTVQGGESVEVTYVDEADSSGRRRVPHVAPVKVVSSAALAVMDGAYRQTVKGVFAGNPAFLRLRDLDCDASAAPDRVTVSVKSYRRRPKPTAEEQAAAAAKGEPIDLEADPWIEIAAGEVTLVESAARSGVFEGRIIPELTDVAAAEAGHILAATEGKLVFDYLDNLHIAGETPIRRTAEVTVLAGGSTDPQSIVSSAADPVLQCRKLLLEAKLLHQWASIFKEVGLDAQASSKAVEGLARLDDLFALSRRQAILREVLENAYAAKWDLLLVKGDLEGAIAVCNELLRVYPDTVLADVAFLRIAKARAESRNVKDMNEAARIYRSVLAMPNSQNKAEAQFLLAAVLEKVARLQTPPGREPNYEASIHAYRACAENYPQSAYAGDSFKRVITWQIEKKDYARALETLERVFQDYPDAPWLDEMLLRWGIVLFRTGDRTGALAKFRRILEEYPSGVAAAQATNFIDKLAATGE